MAVGVLRASEQIAFEDAGCLFLDELPEFGQAGLGGRRPWAGRPLDASRPRRYRSAGHLYSVAGSKCMPIRICVAGATGWAGSAVVRRILQSGDFQLVGVIARQNAGRDIGEVLGG